MAEQKYKFQIKPGFSHEQGTENEAHAGDIVELTVDQARGLLDKLSPIGKVPGLTKDPPRAKAKPSVSHTKKTK